LHLFCSQHSCSIWSQQFIIHSVINITSDYKTISPTKLLFFRHALSKLNKLNTCILLTKQSQVRNSHISSTHHWHAFDITKNKSPTNKCFGHLELHNEFNIISHSKTTSKRNFVLHIQHTSSTQWQKKPKQCLQQSFKYLEHNKLTTQSSKTKQSLINFFTHCCSPNMLTWQNWICKPLLYRVRKPSNNFQCIVKTTRRSIT
jgi:hypothetical protein